MPTHGRGLYRPSSAPPDDPEYAPPSGAAPEYELTPLIPAELREGRAVHVRHDVADSDPPRSVRRPFGHQLLHLRGGSGRSSAAGRSLGYEPAAACASSSSCSAAGEPTEQPLRNEATPRGCRRFFTAFLHTKLVERM